MSAGRNASVHALWLRPAPGVSEPGRIVEAVDEQSETLLILLPDDSKIIISADCALYVRGGQQLCLSQWQLVPAPEDLSPAAGELAAELDGAEELTRELPGVLAEELAGGQPPDWAGEPRREWPERGARRPDWMRHTARDRF